MSTKHTDLEAVAYKLQRERNVALEQRDALLAALRLISDTEAPRGSHAYIMKRIADRAIAAATKE